jgi:hypothetical protein
LETSGRIVRSLVCAFADKDRWGRFQKQDQIEPETLALDIANVQLNLLIEWNVSSAADLPDARETRFDVKAAAVP